ncbi:hypothetical protein FQA39_LY11270 [Lamprigera yunnana]|nr:hypothetical protein FQA39_LY11270 [Lamprigera yunnana]
MIETESESHLSECDGSNESGTESNANRVSTKEVIDQFIKPTILLEDKRRTRTRSVGRPPSQVFIKEKILQNMNLDNSDYEAKTKPVPKIKTTFVEITEKLKADSSSTTPWKNISLKKSSGPVIKSTLKDKVAPWLQELHERRNQKTSSGEGITKSIQEGERYTIVEINRGDVKIKAYDDDSNKQNIFESSQTIKIKVKEQADSVNVSKKQSAPNKYRIPRDLRRHTVHTNLEDVLDNAIKEQLPNEEDAKKIEEDAKQIEADKKHNLIKSLEERIEQFLTQMQTSQATLAQELKKIELSIDNQLEKNVLAIEEIKKELLTLRDKV